MRVARRAWRYRRSCRPAKSRADDPALADRTWVLLTGAPEGGWGLGGHANTNAELISAARTQIAELGKSSPGRSPSSRRRARREAIGLPRFGDPEDLKAVADSARWGEPRWVHAISSRSPAPIAGGHRPCRYLPVPPESRRVAQLPCCTPCLGRVRPFSGANPGS